MSLNHVLKWPKGFWNMTFVPGERNGEKETGGASAKKLHLFKQPFWPR